MSRSKLRQIIDAVIAITKSQRKVQSAIIEDLVNIEQRIVVLEKHLRMVEARRQAELEGKKK
jgi:hypothetical protein